MPPWFVEVMKRCEHLSLDSESDRIHLWTFIALGFPRNAIEAALLEWIPDGVSHKDAEEIAASTCAAVISALESA
jgi:hypothetical protein